MKIANGHCGLVTIEMMEQWQKILKHIALEEQG